MRSEIFSLRLLEIEFCKVMIIEAFAPANAYWVEFGCSRIAVRRAVQNC